MESSFDNYQLVEQIGEGAFGTILKIRRKGTNEQYACKNEILVRKEYLILLQLTDAKYFPRVEQYVQFSQHSYIVMELLGPSLYTKAKRGGKLPLKSVALVARDTFKALRILHDHHFLHRDLKPENILLAGGGHNVKIVDFGLSKTCKNQLPRRTVSIIGNVRYSSVGAHLGYSSKKDDLESLCYVLIYLATGKLPWQALPQQKIRQELQRKNDQEDHYQQTQLLSMKKHINIDMFKNYALEPKERVFLAQLINLTKKIQNLGRESEPNYSLLECEILKLIFLSGADEDDCHQWCAESGCVLGQSKTKCYNRYWSVFH